MTNDLQSVLVLHEAMDANSRPDEVDALIQVEHVSKALRMLGWQVSILATDLNLSTTLTAIAALKPDCVVNLVESLDGDGRLIHFVPSLLRIANVPFTGSGSDAMYLSSQKLLAKRLMRRNGIPTPQSYVPGDETEDDASMWIVKSVWEHASFGMDDGCVVSGLAAARARIDQCESQYGGDWFAERFIDGREFNVSVLEKDGRPQILPIAEMTFVDYPRGKPKIVGYAAKWDAAAPEYHATRRAFVPLPVADYEALCAVVRQCWRLFGLTGYARVDIRMDAAGTPWVLEINANPCLSPDAGFAAAAAEADHSYTQLIESVVSAALN
jgi:D-alanine-D-alanine ligase